LVTRIDVAGSGPCIRTGESSLRTLRQSKTPLHGKVRQL